MSEPVWTIMGVVVGAILGGLAQVIAGVIERRHRVSRWELEHQRDAYVRWIQYLHVLFARLEGGGAATHGGSPPGIGLLGIVEAEEGPRALAELRLVAPDDTYEAARASRDRLVAVFDSGGSEKPALRSGGGDPADPADTFEGLAADFRRQRDEFVVLARRDIGTL